MGRGVAQYSKKTGGTIPYLRRLNISPNQAAILEEVGLTTGASIAHECFKFDASRPDSALKKLMKHVMADKEKFVIEMTRAILEVEAVSSLEKIIGTTNPGASDEWIKAKAVEILETGKDIKFVPDVEGDSNNETVEEEEGF